MAETRYDVDFAGVREQLALGLPCVVVWAPGDGTRYEVVLTPLGRMAHFLSEGEYAFPGAAADDIYVAISNGLGRLTYTFNLLDREANDPIHACYIGEHLGIENGCTVRVMTEMLNRIAGAEPYDCGLAPAEIASFA